MNEKINKLPKKLNSIINENSTNISGGEKQRISMARALYKEPRVLILDESTSSVDKRVEKKILKYLKSIKNDKIIFIISHQDSFLKYVMKLFRYDKKNFTDIYIDQTGFTLNSIDKIKIENLVKNLVNLRKKKGRLFFIGVGGSAANASHAVNDFRKLCGIESYSLSDNVSELTARINDDGWENSYLDILKINKIQSKDGIFVFSVGGGSIKRKISMNIVNAIKYAQIKIEKIFGIVGPNGGYAFKSSDLVLKVDINQKDLITPISESFQAIIWHLIVSHPVLKINRTKW